MPYFSIQAGNCGCLATGSIYQWVLSQMLIPRQKKSNSCQDWSWLTGWEWPMKKVFD